MARRAAGRALDDAARPTPRATQLHHRGSPSWRPPLLKAVDGAVEQSRPAVALGLLLVVGPALWVPEVLVGGRTAVRHGVLVVPLEAVTAPTAEHRARHPVEVRRRAQPQSGPEVGWDVPA